MPMLVTFDRPAVLMDVRDVQSARKPRPMLLTPESPVVSMDMMDAQPRRNCPGILILPWVFVRITCPVGQGDHESIAQFILPVLMS